MSENGYAPSIREMCKHFGTTSIASIQIHLSNLEKKGLIKREHYKSRAIEIVKSNREELKSTEVPIVGTLTEFAPIKSAEKFEFISVPKKMLINRQVYVLQIDGDFMTGEHILNGDYIVIEVRNTAENSDLAVVLLENEKVVLRRITKKEGQLILRPANPDSELIIVREDEISIQGVMIGVIRNFLD